eukprot:5368479-Amphidinium_carterae.1
MVQSHRCSIETKYSASSVSSPSRTRGKSLQILVNPILVRPYPYPPEFLSFKALLYPHFKSVREDWNDWRFQFKAFLSGAYPDASAALDTAGIRDQPIAMADLPPLAQELSRQEYLALCLQ